MNAPIRYLITEGRSTPENFQQKISEILNIVKAAVDAGISMIQIREKEISAKQLFELTAAAAAITSSSSTKLLVNGRFDISRIAGAEGVHLPENGIPVPRVRRTMPKPFLIGASVHSPENAKRVWEHGADFIVFGPVFETPGKRANGIESLEEICSDLEGFPVIAVGGVNETNYQRVLDAGAAGYAAIRFLNDLNVLKTLR
ncbi:MAG: thiamine phosphate synthase [Pyrinomonadaceae bacterium]